jgi:acyl-coenzyme A thioesterase PaaI-like protein
MKDNKAPVDETEVRAFISALPFVQEFSISITSVVPGQVTIELPFDERFSGPPGQFPASIVGLAGDVAAVASCLSLLPNGWSLATLDFTIKMTGAANGNKLRARGRVLQAGRTNSVGAAEVFIVSIDREILCGSVLATTRNFQVGK